MGLAAHRIPVDLPLHLYRRLEKAAQRREQTVGRLIEEAVETQFGVGGRAARHQARELPLSRDSAQAEPNRTQAERTRSRSR